MKDGSLYEGIAALIGACITLAGFLTAVLRKNTWFHAFRSNLDLVAERDAMSAFAKRLTVETMSAISAAKSWEHAYNGLQAEQRVLMSQFAAATRYIRQLHTHALHIEQQAQAFKIPLNATLPPLPDEFAEGSEAKAP